MAEPKICEFEVDIVRVATISTKDQYILRLYILMPTILCQLRVSVEYEALKLPNENVWTSQLVRPLNCMDA